MITFVRSSSNAEDLLGFNGAGLYDTAGNVVGKHALGEAMKKVWASLWNLRAVDERSPRTEVLTRRFHWGSREAPLSPRASGP